MDRQTFTKDLNVRPDLIGAQTLMTPMPEHCSSQRLLMQASALAQSVIVSGNEPARIQSGFETKYGRYCVNPAAREHDVQILDVIQKYTHLSNEMGNVIHSPETTVIYLDTEAEEPTVGYFTVPDYIMLHAGFGYHTKKHNIHELVPGNFIPKEMKFVESPAHDEDLYNLGVNANVCYIPLWGTTNDAFIISRSLQRKMRHTDIKQMTVVIGMDQIPLNMYGDENNYKIFPDVGQRIRDDGILMCIREHSAQSLIADVTSESLRQPSLHDDIRTAAAGSVVVDVNVFVNKSKLNELRSIETYNQIVKYQDSFNAYYVDVINCFNKYQKLGYKIGPEFSALVVQCKSRAYVNEYKDLVLYNKKDPVELIYIDITYASEDDISRGFKLTSRDGAKGVVSDVWEDEDMPYYQNGSQKVHADILVTGESPFNRLNSSQNYEQFINYASDVIVQRCRDNVIPYDQQYDYIIEFIRHVKPAYADFIKEKTNMTPESCIAFVEEVRERGIYYIIPPFTESITPAMVISISNDYNIHHVPLEFFVHDENGDRFKVECKYKGIIGSKYMYLLGKIPLDALSAMEFGYASQFNLPIKPSSNDIKQQSILGCTPGRYGEDETSILTMSLGAKTVCRILGIYSNCLPAQRLLKNHLLNDPYPTRLGSIEMSSEDIVTQSTNVSLFQHMFAACGYKLEQNDVQGGAQ